MQIIIDIPEEEYKRMKEKRMFGNVTTWKDAICNGTPLPKGHGRLIDAKHLGGKIFCEADCGGTAHRCYNSITEIIDRMPTIIEADKEGAEE